MDQCWTLLVETKLVQGNIMQAWIIVNQGMRALKLVNLRDLPSVDLTKANLVPASSIKRLI